MYVRLLSRLRFYGVALLALTGATLAAQSGTPQSDPLIRDLRWRNIGNANLIGRISAEIAGHDEGNDADVRDRDIGRFGEYFAGTVLGIGMVVPFVLAFADSDYFWIANAMYLAFALSAVVGAAVKLIAYRRGI